MIKINLSKLQLALLGIATFSFVAPPIYAASGSGNPPSQQNANPAVDNYQEWFKQQHEKWLEEQKMLKQEVRRRQEETQRENFPKVYKKYSDLVDTYNSSKEEKEELKTAILKKMIGLALSADPDVGYGQLIVPIFDMVELQWKLKSKEMSKDASDNISTIGGAFRGAFKSVIDGLFGTTVLWIIALFAGCTFVVYAIKDFFFSRRTPKVGIFHRKTSQKIPSAQAIMAAINRKVILSKRKKKLSNGQVLDSTYEEVKKYVHALVNAMRKGKTVSALFYGKPGNGKSMVSSIISSFMPRTLRSPGSAFSQFSKKNEVAPVSPIQALKWVLDWGKKSAFRSVGFWHIDEGEVMLIDRTLKTTTAEQKEIVNAFLDATGSPKDRTVCILITTNLANQLDNAAYRRLEYKIEFRAPSRKEMIEAFRHYAKGVLPIKNPREAAALVDHFIRTVGKGAIGKINYSQIQTLVLQLKGEKPRNYKSAITRFVVNEANMKKTFL